MISLSLCMIVKDEEEVLRRCLSSVIGVVDEIVVIDTGSIDNTKKIAEEFTNQIFDFKWVDDFSEARNFSFSNASKDYIMWMDADEYFNEEDRSKLIELKNNLDDNIDSVTFETKIIKNENDCSCFIGRRNRIVKRSKNFQWVGFVHEYIDVNGVVFDSDVSIIHYKIKNVTDRNLKLYEKNINNKVELSDRDLYYYGKELYCNKYYEKAINILEEFIKKDVWIEDRIDSLRKIGKCYLYLNNHKEARSYFYKCFEYISPSIEILYDIAESFEIEKEYLKAISWYELILKLQDSNKFNLCKYIDKNCIIFNVNLSLCVCNFEIGNINKSYYHHLKCKELNAQNPCVIKNDNIFNQIKA